MQKAVVSIRAVLGRVLFIGLSIQIVLGLLWMCCSFTGVQWFVESTFYEKVSETLICDEYTGILYPFLLMLTGKRYILVCLLQLVAALCAGYYFLQAAGVQKVTWKIWGSLVFLTYPMAIQCHMAVLPNSFAFSCFLLELAFAFQSVKMEQKSRHWKLFGLHMAWLGGALLLPDYLYLGAVPVLVLLISVAVKYRKAAGKRLLYQALLSVVFAGMIVSVNQLTQQEGYYGRADKSFSSAVFQRVAWSSLAKYYMDWPADIQDTFDTMEFFDTADHAENMVWLLQPKIEAGIGEETAKKRYLEISWHVIKNNYYQLIYEVAWDTLGNMFPVVVTDLVLDGGGYTSYCVRNYETMRQEAPALTKYYMQYTAAWFVVGIVITAVMQLLGAFTKHVRSWFPAIICIMSAGVMVLWYTMSGAGVWDYKNGLFAGALWIVWMVWLAVKGVEEEL